MQKNSILKRVFAGTLTVFFMIGSTSNVGAGEMKDFKSQKIDSLYVERAELCMDFAKNNEQIKKIDEKLEKLGVETLEDEEVVELLRDVENYDISSVPSVAIATPSEYGIKWTSTRNVVIYRGKQYEVQELKAIPTRPTSSLQTTTSSVTKSATRATASKNLAKIVATEVIGHIPEIGGDLSRGITIYQALKGVYQDLKKTDTVYNIKAAYVHRLGAEYTLEFVKPYGARDSGNQVLCYAGNSVRITANISIPTFKYDGKTYQTGLKNKAYSGTVSSPYYDGNKRNMACKNYCKYKEGKSMEPHYNITKYKETAVDGSKFSINVPRPNYGF